MNRRLFVLCLSCVFVCLTTHATAGIITLAPANDGLVDLLGPGYSTATTLMVTPMNSGTLSAEVNSQAFVNSAGTQYAYLYQVANTGDPVLNTPAEMFTLYPFPGSPSSVQVGYFATTATVPAGFAGGGQVPEPTGAISALPAGLLTSFYYGDRYGYQINPGNHSLVMYLATNLSPGANITANVIDGSVASGAVVGPVPEPATWLLLVSGGLGLCAAARYRRRKAASPESSIWNKS